jgi:hypothetical protein
MMTKVLLTGAAINLPNGTHIGRTTLAQCPFGPGGDDQAPVPVPADVQAHFAAIGAPGETAAGRMTRSVGAQTFVEVVFCFPRQASTFGAAAMLVPQGDDLDSALAGFWTVLRTVQAGPDAFD